MIRLSNVRLSYPFVKEPDHIDLMRVREPTFRAILKFEHWFLAKFSAELGLDPVPLLIGYDAQKLLPSPEKMPPLGSRQMAELWSANFLDEAYKMGLEWRTMFADRVTPIQHKVVVMRVENVDYALFEERILSFYGDKRVREIIIDFDAPSGEINPQMDLYRMAAAMMHKPVAAPEEKRDKSYLKHDPSKQHKRRKRK